MLQTQRRETTSITKPAFLKNIMLATDFSDVADRALEYAVSIARRFDSKLYVTHIIPPDSYAMVPPDPVITAPPLGEFRRRVMRNMEEMPRSGRLIGVSHQTIVKEGVLWPAIDALIKEHNVDLLVLGTHGLGAVVKMLIGSVAEEIFRQARIPVLTVGPAARGEAFYEAEFRNILFATDFGLGAECEAAFAFALGQQNRSRLIFLHVVEDTSKVLSDSERTTTKREMRELVPSGVPLLCKISFEIAHGNPAEAILRIAEQTNADLIVIGAKKDTGISGHVPRSTAYSVVCKAHSPVLTIRS